jgi:hypothetical protein
MHSVPPRRCAWERPTTHGPPSRRLRGPAVSVPGSSRASRLRHRASTVDVLHDGGEPLVVGALPVDPVTLRAPSEVIEVPARAGRQAVFHLLLSPPVRARRCTRGTGRTERSPRRGRTVAGPRWSGGDGRSPARDSRERPWHASRCPRSLVRMSPLLGCRDRRQLVVRDVVSPDAVEAEEPKGSGQPAEMNVQGEPRLSKRWRIQPHERRPGQGLERRVHAHPVAVAHLGARSPPTRRSPRSRRSRCAARRATPPGP